MFNLSQISSDYENSNASMNPSEDQLNTRSGTAPDVRKRKNRTLKRLAKNDLDGKQPVPLTNDIYNSLDESNLAEFPPKPMLAVNERSNRSNFEGNAVREVAESSCEEDDVVTKEDYKLLGPGNDENRFAEKAYQQYLSSHQQWSPLIAQAQSNQSIQNANEPNISSNDNAALLKKLNYMIHLLEEQQNERTNNITEELILYIFLGIFVIFVVDSFTRVGKYTR